MCNVSAHECVRRAPRVTEVHRALVGHLVRRSYHAVLRTADANSEPAEVLASPEPVDDVPHAVVATVAPAGP